LSFRRVMFRKIEDRDPLQATMAVEGAHLKYPNLETIVIEVHFPLDHPSTSVAVDYQPYKEIYCQFLYIDLRPGHHLPMSYQSHSREDESFSRDATSLPLDLSLNLVSSIIVIEDNILGYH